MNAAMGYRRQWLSADLPAGLTVWAILVPEAFGYAVIAGVHPVVGLYAAPPALVMYAILGSSRRLIVGPMAATAAVSATVVGHFVAESGADFATATAALAIVTGVVAIVAGLLRMGFVAGFISQPVLKGFITGLALVIISGQLPKLLGVKKGEGEFFPQMWHLLTHLGDTRVWPLGIGLASLVVALLFKRFMPRLPSALIVVVLGILAVWAFGLESHGVKVVGHIDSGMPSFGLPDLSAGDYASLLGGAMGLALVGFAEGLGAAKTYASDDGEEIDVNRELVGTGAANIGAGLCSGMVVNGSLSKTAVNAGAGARTQVSGLTAALLTVVTLLFLVGLFEKLPDAALGAVVVVAVIDLVDLSSLAGYYRLWRKRRGSIYAPSVPTDFLAAFAALAGVLVFGTLDGLLIGVGVSLLLLLARTSRANVAVLGRVRGGLGGWAESGGPAPVDTDPDVLVVRPESVFFTNADAVRGKITELASEDGVRAVIVDSPALRFLDISGAQALQGLYRDLQNMKLEMFLVGSGQGKDKPSRGVPGSPIRYLYPTIDDAVAAARRGESG